MLNKKLITFVLLGALFSAHLFGAEAKKTHHPLELSAEQKVDMSQPLEVVARTAYSLSRKKIDALRQNGLCAVQKLSNEDLYHALVLLWVGRISGIQVRLQKHSNFLFKKYNAAIKARKQKGTTVHVSEKVSFEGAVCSAQVPKINEHTFLLKALTIKKKVKKFIMYVGTTLRADLSKNFYWKFEEEKELIDFLEELIALEENEQVVPELREYAAFSYIGVMSAISVYLSSILDSHIYAPHVFPSLAHIIHLKNPGIKGLRAFTDMVYFPTALAMAKGTPGAVDKLHAVWEEPISRFYQAVKIELDRRGVREALHRIEPFVYFPPFLGAKVASTLEESLHGFPLSVEEIADLEEDSQGAAGQSVSLKSKKKSKKIQPQATVLLAPFAEEQAKAAVLEKKESVSPKGGWVAPCCRYSHHVAQWFCNDPETVLVSQCYKGEDVEPRKRLLIMLCGQDLIVQGHTIPRICDEYVVKNKLLAQPEIVTDIEHGDYEKIIIPGCIVSAANEKKYGFFEWCIRDGVVFHRSFKIAGNRGGAQELMDKYGEEKQIDFDEKEDFVSQDITESEVPDFVAPVSALWDSEGWWGPAEWDPSSTVLEIKSDQYHHKYLLYAL